MSRAAHRFRFSGLTAGRCRVTAGNGNGFVPVRPLPLAANSNPVPRRFPRFCRFFSGEGSLCHLSLFYQVCNISNVSWMHLRGPMIFLGHVLTTRH